MGYNYFDDDDENEAREKILSEILQNIKSKLNLRRLAGSTKYAFENLVNGNTAKEFRQLPHLKRAILKLIALAIFLILVIVMVFSFVHTIYTQNQKSNQFNADAGKVCTNIITQYGAVKWESLDEDTYGENMARLTGLCYARQMDFDDDGQSELMVCYNDGNTYMLEVYGYVDKEFTKIYSEEANSTSEAVYGSWVGFYFKNNKYYICVCDKENPESVTFYALKGNKFKKAGSCDYDYKNDIYSIKGKINSEDFETIKLSVLKSTKADDITNLVTDNLENFTGTSLTGLENSKSDLEKKNDAFYEIVEKRISQYGEATVKSENGTKYIDGVAYVGLVDFNNDDNEELLISYRKLKKESSTDYYTGNYIVIEEPIYCLEVYNWNGTVANKIFSKESVSTYFEDSSVNYIMLYSNDDDTEICINTYSFDSSNVYSAYSKIYQLNTDKFDTIYNVRMDYDYGYKSYYIDGTYSYQSDFEEKGYDVPMFLNDDGSYNSSTYKVTYLSGKSNYDYQKIVDDTVSCIQKLNKNYLPSED